MNLEQIRHSPWFWGACVVAVTGMVVAIFVFVPHSSPENSPQAAQTIASNDNVSSEDPSVQALKETLSDRVIAFEQAYRSYDWQQSESKRAAQLAEFMTPDALKATLKAENEASVVRTKLEDSHAVKNATVTDTPNGDIEDDLAEVETDVTVESTQADDPTSYTNVITSQTSWVYDNGTWYVYSVSPN